MNTAINHSNYLAGIASQDEMTRMTEVIIPRSSNSEKIIFPLVASMTKQYILNAQGRWLTWITDRKPNSQQLKQFGANIESIRIIHVEKSNDNRWIIWDALNTANSHTVIADIERINNNDIEQMELAAKKGDCTGVLVRAA
ncbi:MAG: cell division inhibitor SulA [Cellvibrionaceae bacterium]|jgi:cell division inhibitor SulA